MSSKFSTVACLSLVAGICAIAQASPPINWTYTRGIWIDDLDIAAPNKANTNYDFEFFRNGVWNNRYSGTTRAAGNDSVWLFDTAGGITNPRPGEAMRLRFANGTTVTMGTPRAQANTNNPDIQGVAMTGGTVTNFGIQIRQNAQEMLDGGNGPAWYLAGHDLSLTLPTGFTWAGMPSVSALGGGLDLGAASLSGDNRSLIIPVVDNDETDVFAGVNISGGTVNYDGSSLATGDVDSIWHGYFRVEGGSSFNEGNGMITQLTILPTPGTGALAIAGGLIAIRRRRK